MFRSSHSRRVFLSGLGALSASSALPVRPASPPLKLGLDNFAVRAFGWKAADLIRYAAELKLDSLFISDLDALPALDDASLASVRAAAQAAGLELYLGTWSICPTSKSFRNTWGTAEEHLALAIRCAKALGSPVIRVILGARGDRATEGGIRARIADTLSVLRSARPLALETGVKIAMENHAGDMTARELLDLVNEAGPDVVGVNFDSGNAAWTLHDPLHALEILGPHILCTSLRDVAAWPTDKGAMVCWTAMGRGLVDWPTFFTRFKKFCPDVPVHIETITGAPNEFPYLDPEFWSLFPDVPAADFARFLAMVQRGRPVESPRVDGRDAQQQFQRAEFESSIAYCRTIGLGRKAQQNTIQTFGP
jgi:3-oxoisoapionate decarboxylase